jgi:hypothetical protein
LVVVLIGQFFWVGGGGQGRTGPILLNGL